MFGSPKLVKQTGRSMMQFVSSGQGYELSKRTSRRTISPRLLRMSSRLPTLCDVALATIPEIGEAVERVMRPRRRKTMKVNSFLPAA
jgi:hypothetical protein